MTQSELKSKTIKWLDSHLEEMMENSLAMNIGDEDKKHNKKIAKEIDECIKWVKSIPIREKKK